MVRRLTAGGKRIRSLGSFGLSKNTAVSASFGERTKRVLSQVLSQKEGTRNPGWCGVLRVKRARSEEGVPFAPPHGDLLSAQHPPAGWLTRREGRCGKVPARPRGKGRSRRVWRAMDQDAESSDRGPPGPASSVTLCRRRWRSTAC